MKTKNEDISLVTYRNEWEYHTYKAFGKELRSIKQVQISGKRYRVRSREVTESYSDMGTSMTAESTQFYITVEIHGAKVELPLSTFARHEVCQVLVKRQDVELRE
jgi:hypothetical protein